MGLPSAVEDVADSVVSLRVLDQLAAVVTKYYRVIQGCLEVLIYPSN